MLVPVERVSQRHRRLDLRGSRRCRPDKRRSRRPRNIHVAPAASPRPASAEYRHPRRLRDLPPRNIHAAPAAIHGISTWHPRRLRDLPPRNIHAAPIGPYSNVAEISTACSRARPLYEDHAPRRHSVPARAANVRFKYAHHEGVEDGLVPAGVDPISAVRAPLLLILAALECWCYPLEVHSNIRIDGQDLRSAIGTRTAPPPAPRRAARPPRPSPPQPRSWPWRARPRCPPRWCCRPSGRAARPTTPCPRPSAPRGRTSGARGRGRRRGPRTAASRRARLETPRARGIFGTAGPRGPVRRLLLRAGLAVFCIACFYARANPELAVFCARGPTPARQSQGVSSSHPRRRRDSSPRTIHADALYC